MKIVIFGLSISSAWGNGHATLLRGLFRALNDRGHEIHFFEKDAPYYAAHRDAAFLPFVNLHLYSDWSEVLNAAKRELGQADAGMVTSYCADGAAACDLVLGSRLSRTVFYDMDTPVTLSRLDRGESVPYIPDDGLGAFDLVLSYTGGQALNRLREQLSARRVSTLYGWVDPEVHYRVEPCDAFAADLSYLGTYSVDRQKALEALLITPANDLKDHKFVIGGAMYPGAARWPANIRHYDHVSPPEHCSFYSSSPLTLNVTRSAMASMGYCPSGRLFEAAACGTAVLSDWWAGLEDFFEPGQEILIAKDGADSIAAITSDRAQLARIGARAKERAFACHTADIRARRLVELIETPRDEADETHQQACVSGGA